MDSPNIFPYDGNIYNYRKSKSLLPQIKLHTFHTMTIFSMFHVLFKTNNYHLWKIINDNCRCWIHIELNRFWKQPLGGIENRQGALSKWCKELFTISWTMTYLYLYACRLKISRSRGINILQIINRNYLINTKMLSFIQHVYFQKLLNWCTFKL